MLLQVVPVAKTLIACKGINEESGTLFKVTSSPAGVLNFNVEPAPPVPTNKVKAVSPLIFPLYISFVTEDVCRHFVM